MIIFKQSDPKWKNDRLGTSKETLGSAGCLVTSIATELYRFNFLADPKWLVVELNKTNGFDSGGRLYFSAIEKVTYGKFKLIDRNPSGKLCTLYEVHMAGTPASWRHWLPGIPGLFKRVGDPIDGKAKSLLFTANYELTGRMAYLKRG